LATPAGYLPYGAGAKFVGMGGAGCALVDDSTSAYYNPAGIVKSQSMALKLGLGTASEGMDKVMATFGSIGNPGKFLIDNYANAIDVNGAANGFLGFLIVSPMYSISFIIR